MCDIDAATLVAEFRKEAARFKPISVLQWNGMSWDYLTIALTSPEIAGADRRDLAKFARKALKAAAILENGVAALRFVIQDPVEVMANVKLPPEPQPVRRQTFSAFDHMPISEIDVVPMDEHRVRRRRAVAAKALLRLERDPNWRPSESEMREIQLAVGARLPM